MSNITQNRNISNWCLVANLQAALANLQADYDALVLRCEEEAEDASNAKARASKFEADFTNLRTKYDRDMGAKNDELEETR